jgi:DNA repair protein RadD
MPLRPYQQHAVDAAIAHMLKSIEPFCIDAATGSGKSHIIAALAEHIHKRTGKRILCLAPSKELVEQDRDKYLATGNPCSTFSAAAGEKSVRHPVVFGSPLTVRNAISRFMKDYALVVIDECHGITPTVQSIVAAMRESNPVLRVCGLTATPYRLGAGYIYEIDADGNPVPASATKDPYFKLCVAHINARDLIAQGFLTQPVIGAIGDEHYDTSGLTLNKMGQFDAESVDRAFIGHGRKTASIVANVIAKAQDRRGVMFFAATVRHAGEIMASLPPELSRVVTGETPKIEREAILREFKSQRVKYLVNVSVLTTGFDAPHVDVIALLRRTESVGLLQQIIGRGLRVSEGKQDVLILDYAENLDYHCPDGDLFAPVIRATKGQPGKLIKCLCPKCSAENTFTANPERVKDGLQMDEWGYLLDLAGQRVETEYGPMPVHFGRRCTGQKPTGPLGEYVQCEYRWTFKTCKRCEAENDISVRYCHACRAELVNPNDKLVADFKAMKRDPTQWQTDEVISMDVKPCVSRAGNPTIRVEWVTPWRQFTTWFRTDDTAHWRARAEYQKWLTETANGIIPPISVTYRKNQTSGFYEIREYDKQPDKEPAREDA